MKRIAIPVFLFLLLALPCAKNLLCLKQEKESYSQKKDAPTMEKDLFNLVNIERQKLDLAPVIFSPPLRLHARKHSQNMALRGDISHLSTSGETYSERLVEGRFYFIKIGENVAYSQTYIPEFIHQGFMDSPGHRANVLDPDFDELGIGVVFKKDKGYYVTQDFIRALAPKGRIEAEVEVEENINRIRRVNSLPPILFLAEANRFAQQCSTNEAKDRSRPPIPSHFGETHVFYSRTPSFDHVYSKYKDKLLDKNYETAGLGIDFSRHEKSPGGAYFITLLLFPESEYKSRSNKDLKEIVLSTINNTRKNKGLLLLKEDIGLATNAKKALKMIYAQKNTSSIAIPRFGRAVVISYVTENPTLLPGGLKSQFEENFIYYKRIGIGIRFEKDSKYPRGAFWVVILIME